MFQQKITMTCVGSIPIHNSLFLFDGVPRKLFPYLYIYYHIHSSDDICRSTTYFLRPLEHVKKI